MHSEIAVRRFGYCQREGSLETQHRDINQNNADHAKRDR